MSPFLFALALTATPESYASGLSPYLAPERTVLEHARAVSLDVRGKVLSLDEVAAIRAAGELDDATLNAWLASEAFADEVVRHHKGLFLNNIAFQFDPDRALRDYGRYGFGIYYVYNRSPLLRGDIGNCSDYDADVNALNQPQSWLTRSDGTLDEGAVDVVPWWDPTTSVRVCAFDAQLTEISSSGNDCSQPEGQDDPECGCGPNLLWCGNNDEVEDLMNRSLSEAISQRVRDVVYEDRSYSTLLTEPSVYVNGPLVEYYRNRVGFSDIFSLPVPLEELPDLPPDAFDTWMELPADVQYAGALTDPGWLLRFQTNRGRANRFFTEFLCGEFLPPESGIMEIAEENPTPDLSQKPVCMDCHTVLEPWAAHWGRWQQVSSVYLDEEAFPVYSEECATCAPYCSTYCRTNYLTEESHPHEDGYLGTLNAYLFLVGDADEHPDLGPAEWAQQISDDGRLARCAAEKAAIWLLGKPEQQISPELIDGWASDFTASGLSYQALVRAIVTSPAYGRAR